MVSREIVEVRTLGRYKKLTPEEFGRKVDKYFKSISRTVTATEKVESGQYTEKGYPILKTVPIMNDAGKEIKLTQFITPPSISGLCLYLCIARQTFDNYAHDDEYAETALFAKAKIESYLESELVSRVKGVDGIKFNLENNYDWKQKHEMSGGFGSVEKFLESLPESGEEF